MRFARVFVIQHAQLLGANEPAITSRQAYRFTARLIDQAHNILLHLTSQHPFNHFHRFIVRHTHALNKFAFFTQAVQRRFNLRTPAVNDDRIHTHQLEQHDVFCKVRLQCWVRHGIATIFNDHGFAVKFPNVRQRLRQDFGFVARANVGQVGVSK